MEKKVYELAIDEEFMKVAPPLAENELMNLREDIQLRGCLVPIITWKGTIIDGHNRYAICRENNIPFTFTEMEFVDRTEAILWIIRNQLGRRNLTKFQRCEMILPMEEKIKAESEERRRALISEYRTSGETVPKTAASNRTRDILAQIAGVGHTMLEMVKTILEMADEETKEKLRHDEVKVNAVYKSLRGKPKEKKEKKIAEVPEEPAIQIDSPTVMEDAVAQEEEKSFTPADFSEVEAQVEICIQDFMMNFRETMKWIGQQHLSGKNESAVKGLLKEGYEAAVEALHNRFEELKGEAK